MLCIVPLILIDNNLPSHYLLKRDYSMYLQGQIYFHLLLIKKMKLTKPYFNLIREGQKKKKKEKRKKS